MLKKSLESTIKAIVISNLLLASISVAGTGNTIGMGIRNMSLGGAANLTDPGVYAAKENPAALTRSDKILLSIAFTDNGLNLEDANSYRSMPTPSDMSADSYQASAADNLQHVNAAFSVKLNNLFSFGVSGMIPSKHLGYLYAFTGNESQYLQYSDRQQSPEIYTALGLKLPANFSLGAGIFYSVKVDGKVQFAISQTDADSRMTTKLNPVYLPYVGLNFQKEILPEQTLFLGATYKDKHCSTNKASVETIFASGLGRTSFAIDSQLVLLYDPAVLAFGAGYKYKNASIHVGFQKNFWSKYKAPIIDLSGDDLDSILSGNPPINYGPIVLKDTYSYRLGIEIEELIRVLDISTDARAGVELHTSAMPDYPQNLAVIDTRRVATSLGFGFNVPGIGSLVTKPFTFDIGVKYSQLESMDLQVIESGAVTQTASIGGNILTLMGGVSLEF